MRLVLILKAAEGKHVGRCKMKISELLQVGVNTWSRVPRSEPCQDQQQLGSGLSPVQVHCEPFIPTEVLAMHHYSRNFRV